MTPQQLAEIKQAFRDTYIPGRLAVQCVDCDAVYYSQATQCPGCTSKDRIPVAVWTQGRYGTPPPVAE